MAQFYVNKNIYEVLSTYPPHPWQRFLTQMLTFRWYISFLPWSFENFNSSMDWTDTREKYFKSLLVIFMLIKMFPVYQRQVWTQRSNILQNLSQGLSPYWWHFPLFPIGLYNSFSKWAKDMNRHISKEYMHVANKYMRTYSISLIIREMQTKTTLRYLTPVKIVHIQKTDNNEFW